MKQETREKVNKSQKFTVKKEYNLFTSTAEVL